MQNQRHSPRAPVVAVVDITEVATGTHLSARTSDLSRTGCYIDTLNPMESKTVVKVCLKHNAEELELPGRIVYVSPRLGMGVRFDQDLLPAQVAVLERWLANEAPSE
jgi:PilZ domain